LEEGEEYEKEEKNWPEPTYAKFKTQKIQFVVCLNTMGQDRAFTEDE
jgi:intracellular sulfur oxidation DsrE/DsrF family protein